MPLEHLGMVEPWLGGQEVLQLWGYWDVGSFWLCLCGSCWAHQVPSMRNDNKKPRVLQGSSVAVTALALLLHRKGSQEPNL